MLRIVIFDDEERIGLQLKELLEQSGDDLVVDFFQDWHALQFYFSQHAHIDAVFMDICFQGSTSSGIDFAEKIAQSHSQTKFIYVTGHPREYLQQIFMSKTVIIGGVAGGATAAARLRRRDEGMEIVVLEKGGYISFANCGLPYYIGDVIRSREALLLQTPEGMKSKFNIDVRMILQ